MILSAKTSLWLARNSNERLVEGFKVSVVEGRRVVVRVREVVVGGLRVRMLIDDWGRAIVVVGYAVSEY